MIEINPVLVVILMFGGIVLGLVLGHPIAFVLGGVATSGLMCSMSNYFCTRDGTQVTTGLPIEFLDRLVREGGTMAGYLRPTQPQIPNDPEVVKRTMIEMLRGLKVIAERA